MEQGRGKEGGKANGSHGQGARTLYYVILMSVLHFGGSNVIDYTPWWKKRAVYVSKRREGGTISGRHCQRLNATWINICVPFQWSQCCRFDAFLEEIYNMG